MLGERFYKIVVSALITIIFLGSNNYLMAQTFTPDHKIYDLVYGSLLKYERKSTFRTSNQMKAFESLFEDPNCLIPNDVLADNNLDKNVSIYKYAGIRSEYCRFPFKVNLDILEFSSINYINDSSTAEVKVILNKQISNKYLKDKGHIYHYKDTFKFEIIYHINLKTLNPLISEIKYTEPPGKYARITFFQKGIKRILFDGSIYDIADTNERLMRRLDTITQKEIIALDRRFLRSETITFNGKTYTNSQSTQAKPLWDKNQVPIHFKKSFLTLGSKYTHIPDVKSNYIFPKKDNISTRIGNEGYEFNLDLAFRLLKVYDIGISFTTGVSFFNYQIEQQLANTSYSYNEVDPDAQNYIRIVDVNGFKEVDEINGYAIPLLIELSYQKTKDDEYNFEKSKWRPKLYPYLNFGLVYISNPKTKYDVSSNVKYSGFYEDLFGYTFNEGLYDFGAYELKNNGEMNILSNNWAFNTGLGLKLNINNFWNISIGLRYQHFLTNFVNDSDSEVYTKNAEELRSSENYGMNFKLNNIAFQTGIEIRL